MTTTNLQHVLLNNWSQPLSKFRTDQAEHKPGYIWLGLLHPGWWSSWAKIRRQYYFRSWNISKPLKLIQHLMFLQANHCPLTSQILFVWLDLFLLLSQLVFFTYFLELNNCNAAQYGISNFEKHRMHFFEVFNFDA